LEDEKYIITLNNTSKNENILKYLGYILYIRDTRRYSIFSNEFYTNSGNLNLVLQGNIGRKYEHFAIIASFVSPTLE
jgi:hypothetical protein